MPKMHLQKIKDRAQLWVRSFGEWFKRPLEWRDLSIGLLVALGILVITQTPYLVVHAKYWVTRAPWGAVNDIRSEDVNLDPNRLYIPRIDLEVPLVYIESDKEEAIQYGLRRGVVHYTGTAMPGTPGNAYFVGHSSDLLWKSGNYKTVFALLPYLRVDDPIFLTSPSGERFQYRVIETKIVRPTDLEVLDQGENGRKLLTLQTSYPVGTALRRYLVIAELVVE